MACTEFECCLSHLAGCISLERTVTGVVFGTADCLARFLLRGV